MTEEFVSSNVYGHCSTDVSFDTCFMAPLAMAHWFLKLTQLITMTPAIPPVRALCKKRHAKGFTVNYDKSHKWTKRTFPLTNGIRIPIVKIPSKGPFVMASRLMVSCKTVPSFSTRTTNATLRMPTPTTTERIIKLIALSERGRFTNGLQKSSRTTADIELRHVDRELRAALKTPAMKIPDKPGKSPSTSITNRGKS